MRRIVFTSLIIVLFINCFSFQTAYSSGCEIELSASRVGNNYIDVTVSVKSNPGFVTFMLKIHFDNKKLEPVYVTKGSLLPNSGFSNNLSEGDLSTLSYVQTYFVSLSDIVSDGVLYTVRFSINENTNERFVFYLDNNCEMLKNNPEDLNNPDDISFTSNVERFPLAEIPVEIMFVNDDLSVSNGKWIGSVKGLILEKDGAAPIIPENDIVVLAAYNSSHKFVYAEFATIASLSQYSTQPFTINNITIPASDGQPLELKLFLWNSIGQMKPLAENDVRIITVPK